MSTREMIINVSVKATHNTREWITQEDLWYEDLEGLCLTIKVPEGFITDGASIPMLLRPIFPHGGAKFPCAIIHDYLYREGLYSKEVSDQVFYDAMIINGVKEWKAKLMHLGLRIGGGITWRKYRKLKRS